MNPYLTPASRLRADALHRDSWSDRRDGIAEDMERAGHPARAAAEYRRSADYLRDAAAILRRAAETEGGTPHDLAEAELFDRAAAHRDALADRLSG